MPGNSPSLMEALTMYKQAGADFANSMGQLANQRAVTGANNAVQDIKASEKSDADKQAAIRGIANQLTMHLTANGDMPMDRIQGIQNALSPKPPTFQNPFEAYTSSQPGAKQSAIDYEKMMTDEEIRKQRANPLARLKMENEMSEFATKEIGKMSDKANPALASSRIAFGSSQAMIQRLDKMDGALGKDPSKMNSIQRQEVATDLDSVFSGGVPTEGAVRGLISKGTADKVAQAKEYLLNKPEALNTPEFAKLYMDIKDRIKTVALGQQIGVQKQIMRSKLGLAKSDPDKFNAAVSGILGPDEGAQIVKDANGKPKIRFTSDDIEDKIRDGFKWAMKNPTDPNVGAVVEKLQSDPAYAPFYHSVLMQDKALSNKVGNFLKARSAWASGDSQ